MAPKKGGKAPAKAVKKTYDYSGLVEGMQCQVESDGTYYSGSIVAVSTSKNRTKAPVKVSYKGYEGYDEWVSGDRLRSKALKVEAPPKTEKAPREPQALSTAAEIPIKRVARVYSFKVADEAAAVAADALVSEAHALFLSKKVKGYQKMYRQVCKSEWAYEAGFILNNFENFKAYDESEVRKENMLPIAAKFKELAVGGEVHTGVRVYDEIR